jgi:hypothetical protein
VAKRVEISLLRGQCHCVAQAFDLEICNLAAPIDARAALGSPSRRDLPLIQTVNALS